MAVFKLIDCCTPRIFVRNQTTENLYLSEIVHLWKRTGILHFSTQYTTPLLVQTLKMLPGLARFSVASLMTGQPQEQSLFSPYSPSYPGIHSMDKAPVFPTDCYRRQDFAAPPPTPPNSGQQFWPNGSSAWCSPPGMQYGGALNTYNSNPGMYRLNLILSKVHMHFLMP